MAFSTPQPIPSRSSHPVHSHQRPLIRRSQSQSASSTAAPATNTSSSAKFGLSRLLANSDHHHLCQPDLSGDLNLDHEDDDDDESTRVDDDDDIDEVRIDSGHYTSDLSLAAESRGIPIGKPSFLSHQKNNGHLYGTAGGSMDSRGRLSEDLRDGAQFRYRHSHSNSDGHNSINLIAGNFKTKHSPKVNDTRPVEPSLAHFQYQPQQQQQQQQQLQLQEHDQEHEQEQERGQEKQQQDISLPPCSSATPVASPVSMHSPSTTTPASIAIPHRAHRRVDARFSQLNHHSPQDGPERIQDISALVNNNTNLSTKSTKSEANTHPHVFPNISIDTSKARLQKTEPTKTVPTLASVSEASRTRPPTVPRPQSDGPLAFGLKKDDRASNASAPAPAPAPAPAYSFPTLPNSSSATTPSSSNSSTRPLMMASQSRLSSALPPTPTFHHQSFSAQGTQSSVLMPSLSPSSPRVNSALVNSLEQLSVSWKTPEHTPSFPIDRFHRSRTMSSGMQPNPNSSFSSNWTLGSSNLANQCQNNVMSPSAMVTSSSYSSLPYSPAVAFLSNFVDVTAPRMAPDEEGEQVGDFIMGKVIGHGGFSVVREAFAIHLDGLVAQVAVKIVKTQTGLTDNDRVQRMLDKEIAIWSRLSHPNVLPFLAVEKLPTDTFVFCELCTGGHLLDYLTRQEASSYLSPRAGQTVGLEESQARVIFNQIAEAVRYLHEEKRIVHRDIKLENILQHEDGTWKICDFGLAEYQNDEAASYFGSPLSPTMYNPRASVGVNGLQESPSSVRSSEGGCFDLAGSAAAAAATAAAGANMEEEQDDIVGGSLAYCSPEQLRSQKPLRCPSSDVWSLGVVLYALLTGRLPFQDEYEPRLQYQILNGRYEDPTECSPEARDLLKNMFRSKPEDRWRIGQVIDSPWCMGTTLESSASDSGYMGFGGGNHGNGGGMGGMGGGGDHAKMNNFFSTFRF